MFDWSDDRRYEWAIYGRWSRQSGVFWGFVNDFVLPLIVVLPAISYVVTLFAVLLLLLVAFPILYVLGVRPDPGTEQNEILLFWMGIGITMALIAAILYLFSQIWLGTVKWKLRATAHLHELLATAVGIVAFVMTKLTPTGFKGSTESVSQWLGFFVQEALRVILLDIPDIFDIRLSNIEASAAVAQLELVFFRFLIAAGLINTLRVVYKRQSEREFFVGTVKECFWRCQHLMDRPSLQLQRVGRVERLGNPEPPVALVDFIEAFGERPH